MSISGYIVSVLFNEPKLLKLEDPALLALFRAGFSALQRAEIAEIITTVFGYSKTLRFQCSSTSRNC